MVVVYRSRRSLAEHDIAGIASLELNLDLQLLPLVLIPLWRGLNNNLDTTHLFLKRRMGEKGDGAGQCAMRGSCGKKGWMGKELPCPYNGPPSEVGL